MLIILKILFLSHTYIGGDFVVGSHHLSKSLSEMGHDVYHMSTPISLFHLLLKKNYLKFKLALKYNYEMKKDTGVKNLIPISLMPWSLAKYIYIVSKGKLNLSSIIINKIPKDFDVIYMDQPTFLGVEKKIGYKKLIYRPTDVYPVIRNDETIELLESKILNVSNSVVCTSEPVKKYIQNLGFKGKINIIENGVNISHFTKAKNINNRSNKLSLDKNDLNIIYFGALDDRFDFNIILKVAKARPMYKFHIIGPMSKYVPKELTSMSNINLIGPVDYNLLPDYMIDMNLAILPLNENDANQGRSPMKIYEYLAGGKLVVTKKTLELDRRNDINIHMYNNFEELVEILDKVYNSELFFRETDYSIFDWHSKASQLISLI